MNDIKALRQVVLERAATLAQARLERHLPWEDIKAGEYELEDLLTAVYLYGVRDRMDYLGHLLEEGAEA